MKPRGLLMIEHRLIEKMISLIKKELARLNSGESQKPDPKFLDNAIDFIRTYADRTHHGKEEDILFAKLAEKNTQGDDAVMMQDLINEHKEARQHVKNLRESGDEYFGGDTSKIQDIKKAMVWIVNFYPVHIKKEDDIFFPRTEKMFSPEELDAMLEEFYEFDRKMIHEKYKKLVESLL